MTYHDLLDQVESAFAKVPAREKQILDWRFGLATGKGRSRNRIAKDIGISVERARQLEHKGLRLLKLHLALIQKLCE